MEPLPKFYELETIAQMRAIADELRVRILDALTIAPLTATQLATQLDASAAKVHYHVRELERVGLVQVVEVRTRGGMAEKYYRAVARSFSFSSDLFGRISADERVTTTSAILREATRGFLAAFSSTVSLPAPRPWRAVLHGAQVWLTDDEMAIVLEGLTALLEPYMAGERAVPAGARERVAYAFLYDVHVPAEPTPDDHDDPAAEGSRERDELVGDG